MLWIHGPLVRELWPRYRDGLATVYTLIRRPTVTWPPNLFPTLCPIGNGFSEHAI